MDETEPGGDRLEPTALRRLIRIGGDVGGVDDLADRDQRRVARQPVLDQDALERAATVDVAELGAVDVERNRALARRHLGDLLGGDEQELRIGIHEAPDEPRAGDAIHGSVLTGDPFHGVLSPFLCVW